MKFNLARKILLILLVGLLAAASVPAQSDTNSPATNTISVAPAFFAFHVQTNVNTVIPPIVLTSAQVDAFLTLVESNGVASDVPVTSSNLLALTAVRTRVRNNNYFTVTIRLAR